MDLQVRTSLDNKKIERLVRREVSLRMKKLDTAELLAEEDEKALQFIQTVKQNLSSILGADNIINGVNVKT